MIQSQGEPKDKVASKKKKNGPAMVSRPIICICNDLYTPSLRPLRQIALVLQFPPTNPTRYSILFNINRNLAIVHTLVQQLVMVSG